jgi:hypothetical protein
LSCNAYQTDKAKLLVLCSNLCYEQFSLARQDPSYSGDISKLPSYPKLPDDYEQVGTLTAPEMNFGQGSAFVEKICRDPDFDVTNHGRLQVLKAGIEEMYFGFLLQSKAGKGNNIVAFRGTHTLGEWLIDFTAIQVPLPLAWSEGGTGLELARVHLGLLIQYAFLFEQVEKGVALFDKYLPVYVTGHSLGLPWLCSVSRLSGFSSTPWKTFWGGFTFITSPAPGWATMPLQTLSIPWFRTATASSTWPTSSRWCRLRP